MNEKYKFTIDKLVSIKEIIKNIEETNYIDGYLGYESDFYIDSILYYLKENALLKDKIEKTKQFYLHELLKRENLQKPMKMSWESVEMFNILDGNK